MSHVIGNCYDYPVPRGSFVVICRKETEEPFKPEMGCCFVGLLLTFLLNGRMQMEGFVSYARGLSSWLSLLLSSVVKSMDTG